MLTANLPAADCGTATAVSASTLPLGIVIDPSDLSDLASTPCATDAAGGPETWFHLAGLAPRARYRVETSDVEGESDTRLVIYSGTCADRIILACTDDTPESAFASADFDAPESGDVLVMVECAGTTPPAPFQVSFSAYSSPVPGASCENPVSPPDPLVLPWQVRVTPGELSNSTGVSCGPGIGGPEAWIALPALPAGEYILETLPVAGSTITDTRIELFSGSSCASLSSLACNDDADSRNGNAFSSIRFSPSGSPLLALVEEGGREGEGSIDVRLSNAPPAGHDACDSALDLTTMALPISMGEDLAASLDRARIPCAPDGPAVDRWYRLPPLEEGTLYTAATFATAGEDPVATSLAIYRGDCASPTLVACNTGGSGYASLVFAGAAGATHYLAVEAQPLGATVRFDLRLLATGATTPARNTTCDNAADAGTAGLPFDAAADVRGLAAAETWYAFAPRAAGRYLLSASSDNDAELVQLSVTAGGCAASTPVCGSPALGPTPSVLLNAEPATSYLVRVSDPDPANLPATYHLHIEGPVSQALAPNATCANATTATAFPFNDAQGVGGSDTLDIAGALGAVGCQGELYYAPHASSAGAFRVTAHSAAGAPAAIALLDNCPPSTPVEVVSGEGRFRVQAGETPLFAVEPFDPLLDENLEVRIEFEPAASNDTCAGAAPAGSVPFAFPVDLSLANDEGVESPCSRTPARRDVFWSFTPTDAGTYRFVAGGSNTGPDLGLAVLEGDCTNLQVFACADRTPAGETLAVPLLAGTTYHLMVEGGGAAARMVCAPASATLSAARVSSPTSNAACTTATPIGLASLPYATNVDTSGNPSDGPTQPGPSAAWKIDLPVAGLLTARATPAGADSDVAVTFALGQCPGGGARDISGQAVVTTANGQGPGLAEQASVFYNQGDPLYLYLEHADPSGGSVDIELTIQFPKSGWLLQ